MFNGLDSAVDTCVAGEGEVMRVIGAHIWTYCIFGEGRHLNLVGCAPACTARAAETGTAGAAIWSSRPRKRPPAVRVFPGRS